MAMPQRPDHILIETSGLALPKPLLKAFDWPAIRSKITVDGVIALADAEAVAAGRFAPDVAAVDAQRAADDSLDHETPALGSLRGSDRLRRYCAAVESRSGRRGRACRCESRDRRRSAAQAADLGDDRWRD